MSSVVKQEWDAGLDGKPGQAAAQTPVAAAAPAADPGTAAMILALEGADRPAIQSFLTETARRLSAAGTKVLGVVEHVPADGPLEDVLLLDLATGETLPLHQNLGSGASACSLDPSSLAAACAWVENAIAARLAAAEDGAETVVILSKFGRQEAAGQGLTGAFHAAVAAELKIITSVSPSVRTEWADFVGDLAEMAAPRAEAVTAWWAAHGGKVA